MATRQVFTIDDVIGELDENADYEDDSDDAFEGYVDEDESDGVQGLEANVEVSEAEMDIVTTYDNSDIDTPEFSLEPGCAMQIQSGRPLDYLSLLITESMLEHIATQTNLSAQQYIDTHDLPPHSCVRRWSKTAHDDHCE